MDLSHTALGRWLNAPDVEEIMINGPHKAFVIRAGQKQAVTLELADDQALQREIAALVRAAGRTLDQRTPLVDVRLPDGSRLHAVLPPIAPATTVTIRRFVLRGRSLDDLTALGMLNADLALLLRAAVRAGLNLLISGGTSSGKTTLLNALAATVDPRERLVTIEETRELSLEHALEDVCALECHPLPDGRVVSVRDLVRNALRMRPDRIIVGEVRGAEALDVLGAMNSGHDGSMCTLHADTPRDALAKFHTYALLSGERIPSQAIQELMARAIHLVVHCRRARDGHQRYVASVFELTGFQNGVFVGHELFVQRANEWAWSGVRPQCEARLAATGLDIERLWRRAARLVDVPRVW